MYRNIKNIGCTDLTMNLNSGEIFTNNFDYVGNISRYRSNINLLFKTNSFNTTHDIARCIHDNSSRKTKSFIKYNCNKTHKNLVDIELFGCAPGTYRDVPKGKRGILEICKGGTVYIEEVSYLPLYVQYKLIELIEEGTLNKSGALDKIVLDVNLIVSTKKDLEHLMKEGLFKEGLYYSLFKIDLTL